MSVLSTAALLTPAYAAPPEAVDAIRVVVETNFGPFTVELYPREAPANVARFLARAGGGPLPAGVREVAPYAGSQLCESRAHGYLVFGCVPHDGGPERPRAPRKEPPAPDEIDAAALGLGTRTIDDPADVNWLWQSEIVPRYTRLREAGKPVPAGLEALVDGLERDGTAATARLAGTSRQLYLEALGFRYAPGLSARPVARGAVATANTWPDEADERFLIALDDMPERDGRATVFGRVVDGWNTVLAIAELPVDKLRRPLAPVHVTRITTTPLTSPEVTR